MSSVEPGLIGNGSGLARSRRVAICLIGNPWTHSRHGSLRCGTSHHFASAIAAGREWLLLVHTSSTPQALDIVMQTVHEVRIPPRGLAALVEGPASARGMVIFAHGSGSGRMSPRNQHVAAQLRQAGFATLLLDLLTPEEERDRANVFDIELLAERLSDAARWSRSEPETAALALGFFGASTGAAAALTAASRGGNEVAAVVSRGGRPDLAGTALAHVKAPTLLIVGSLDVQVITLNRVALEQLGCTKALSIVPGASHLFEERGTLDAVVHLTVAWFERFLPQA